MENLHPTNGMHWVVYINENCFDSFGCPPPEKLSRFNGKRNGLGLHSEYKIQILVFYSAAYYLYKIYLI